MNSGLPRFYLLGMFMVAGILPSHAAGATFTFTTINLSFGVGFGVAEALDNNGVVSGRFGNDGSAYLRNINGGPVIFLTLPGSDYNQINDINDLGQIVGRSSNDIFQPDQSFIRALDGTFSLSTIPDSLVPLAINNLGQVVGFLSPGGTTGFLREPNGTVTTINVPGSVNTVAMAINNLGQIVGIYDFFVDSAGHQNGRGFIRNADGSFTMFDVPGWLFTGATSINDAGQIVGMGAEAFLRDSNGEFSTFGNGQVSFLDINNAGQILGQGFGQNGFIATTTVTPEPAAASLTLASLVLLLARRLRKQFDLPPAGATRTSI